MYIRESRRTYKDKTYTNYVLVESVQTAKGPRQKTVCSLGDLGPRPREGWLKLAHKIADALVGQGDLIETADAELAEAAKRAREGRRKRTSPNAAAARPAARPGGAPWIAVDPSRVTTEQHREAGPVHLGHQFWRRLGLDDILRACGLSEVVRQLACVMVLNRLIAPASEHAMPDWARRTALADILGADFADLDEQPLYRVLDKLHPHRSAIEEALVARERGLFNLDSTIYLYDLTSTYFEGLAARNAKAQRGYSRDHRPDCKQVVVGLVVNRDGFPITHEVFAGNTQDRTTLPAMLDRLTARAGLQAGATVVVDRGMAYAENLAEIQRRGFHHVVAGRQPERDRWLAEFEDTAGFTPVLRTPSPRHPAQQKTAIEIKTCAAGALTYVLCRSEQRIAKDQAIRSKQEGRLKADLDRLSQRLSAGTLIKPEKVNQAIGRLQERYPRVARYFRISHQPQTATLCCDFDAVKHARAEQLDGCYLLKTDRPDLSGEALWHLYGLLTHAENAFRDMKSPLAERPIFHQLDRRTETHIFLCVLAYHLLIAIEKILLDQGIHTSWATVRDTLKTHQLCTVVLPTSNGSSLRIRKAATPEPEVATLYRHLAIPAQVIHPRHSWPDPDDSD
ncbi:MAG: IS1634 family transposase [Acetobacteraceae bacterium]